MAKTKRIYYGPEGAERSLWWTVKVKDASSPVTLNGEMMHALQGHRGVTIGCALSRMAMAGARAFSHKCYLASFTKSTALIVDKLARDGRPAHAVRYAHSYGHITDMNDRGTLRVMATEDPDIMEREFTLRLPPRVSPSGRGAGQTPRERRGQSDHGQAFVPRGALARAVLAGRIGAHVAEQISEVAAAGNVLKYAGRSQGDSSQRQTAGGATVMLFPLVALKDDPILERSQQ